MAILTIQQRLNALPTALKDPRFLSSRGIGNEIGFYVFDYDPEHEPLVQKHLPTLRSKLEGQPQALTVVEINLYQTTLDILNSRGFLQKAFDLEAKSGSAKLAKSIKPIVRPEQIIEYVQGRLSGHEDIILITGVGASWPILRSHTVLNNLHPVLDKVPVVMFFPGSYDGHELNLFNTLKDDNYYRAFPLIPRQEQIA
jgi:hypothetical protein